MASIVERNGRFRALVRKNGVTRCETFPTKKQAKLWAVQQEAELDELRATGVLSANGVSLEQLIIRYESEVYRLKPWGRSKSAILRRLREDVGKWPAARINSAMILDYLRRRRDAGAGPVTIAGIESTLYTVLTTARALWSLDLPVAAAKDARIVVRKTRMAAGSNRRDRRVSDAELELVMEQLRQQNSTIPTTDVIEFCLATGMRISEVTRLTWQDLNEQARTIMIRDRKHPTDKLGNDQVVPLLNATGHDAMAIVLRQPRISPRIFPYQSHTVGTYFSRAVRAAGIEDLHLHDLRHEAISRLFAAGFRIEQVALVSGHRSWQMLKRYTHIKATDLVAMEFGK